MADKNAQNDKLLDDGLEALKEERPSINLTPANARFYRSKGGLVSMDLTLEDGTVETYERTVILRAFPMSDADHYISVREVSPHKSDRGKEVGMIVDLHTFDEESVSLINEELDRRYFFPVIEKIYSIKEKFGYYYWDIETNAGRSTVILNDPFNRIKTLETGVVQMTSVDGIQMIIPDPKKLDPASYKKIEIYI